MKWYVEISFIGIQGNWLKFVFSQTQRVNGSQHPKMKHCKLVMIPYVPREPIGKSKSIYEGVLVVSRIPIISEKCVLSFALITSVRSSSNLATQVFLASFRLLLNMPSKQFGWLGHTDGVCA